MRTTLLTAISLLLYTVFSMTNRQQMNRLYQLLMCRYGPQGWWPLHISEEGEFDRIGYHPEAYDYPTNDRQRLEICIGAILTQNTNWKNVVKALLQIGLYDLLSLEKLFTLPQSELADIIRPVGYCNQKAGYLKNLSRFLLDTPFEELMAMSTGIVRRLLLRVKGIGRETADCILLYALRKSSFVVDAYTTRVLWQLKLIDTGMHYGKIKHLIESAIDPNLILYQEYHALLVTHGKRYYSKKPYGNSDPILSRMAE